MLSYRHGFHAGNHADVLKHAITLQIIEYLKLKEKPFSVFDTHAGAGLYDLNDNFSQKNKEHLNGIGMLHNSNSLTSQILINYVALVKKANAEGELRYYPGSPWIAQSSVRKQDSVTLFELHTSEAPTLSKSTGLAKNRRRTQVIEGDGLKGLLPLLPPPSRRAFTLIDPAYERDEEYANVGTCLQQALKRFSSGTYAIWYPVVNKYVSAKFSDKLIEQTDLPWLNVELHVSTQNKNGMNGSGLFIVNPPWTLHAELQSTLPELVTLLAVDSSSAFKLEHSKNN